MLRLSQRWGRLSVSGVQCSSSLLLFQPYRSRFGSVTMSSLTYVPLERPTVRSVLLCVRRLRLFPFFQRSLDYYHGGSSGAYSSWQSAMRGWLLLTFHTPFGWARQQCWFV